MTEQIIKVLQFYDYFSLPQPTEYGECVYFKTDEKVYESLEKIKVLPITHIIERINLKGFYTASSRLYQRWELDKENGTLYLITSEKGTYSYDTCTQIYIQKFPYAYIKYNHIFEGIEFVFTTEDENIVSIILRLDYYVRFVTDKLLVHEEVGYPLDTIEEIYHLIHNDEYTWYEKSMLIHRKILGEEYDLKTCSKDRPDKVSRWVDKLGNNRNIVQPVKDYNDEGCNCSEYTLDDWVFKKSVFLSRTIQFLLKTKKVSFSAKAIMMFLAFHSFNSSEDYNKTKECLRSYARNLYKGTENGLNELVKLGWLEMNEYRDLDICQWQCERYGYHVCIYEHYSLSKTFTNLVGWSFV